MGQTEIYTKSYCSYCHRAKELLSIKDIPFVEYDVTSDAPLEKQMRERSGRHTVPQIFINDKHIGGCNELFALDESGGLDPILRQA